MLFKIKHADKIVGLFIIIAIVSFCLVLLVIGINKQWFTVNHPFESRFLSASGISKGMPISLSGFEVGKVTSLTLNDNNQVDITFVVYDRYIDKIKENSVLELAVSPIGLGGGMVIYPGKNSGERLPDHSFIYSTQMKEGQTLVKAGLVDKPKSSDSISELLININSTVMDLNDLITGEADTPLANTIRELEGTMANVNLITEDIAALSDGLRSPEGLIPTLLSSPGSSIDTFFHDDNKLYNRIYSAIGNLDDSMGNISLLTSSLSGLTPELSLVLEELTSTMDGAQKVMEGLQNNPLLKQGISQEKEAERSKSDIRDENF